MKISEIPYDERPREKAIFNGIDTLTNIELLAIIIRSGTKNKSAIEKLNYFKEIGLKTYVDEEGAIRNVGEELKKVLQKLPKAP